jgi:hypothetical protein
MSYAFHAQAEAELNEAVDYYTARQPGLGRDFAHEVGYCDPEYPCLS